MFLSNELKKAHDNHIRSDIPLFAEEIIADRRKIQMWDIEQLVNDKPKQIYPFVGAWVLVETFYGDEDDAISKCFELKNSVKPGRLNSFRAVPHGK